jgi:hypothetical protein
MSIAALGFGALSDAIGITDAYWYFPFLWFIALPLVKLLPSRGAPLAQPVTN